MSTAAATIRKAIAADVPKIVELVDAAYAPYVARLGKKPGPMLDDYAARVAAGEAWVAIIDGAILGVLVIIDEQARFLLDNVAVQPSVAKRGLGRRLVSFAEEEALRRGASALDLYTHALMSENIALYGRLGYVEVGRVHEKGFDRVYMRKRICGSS